mmetsp:Transcript_69319/g.196449  ORF Transcript_69319/g.196449 Transcript_69319/m.196449 type:complete len:208 (-) Transcript_69319:10-633(-)
MEPRVRLVPTLRHDLWESAVLVATAEGSHCLLVCSGATRRGIGPVQAMHGLRLRRLLRQGLNTVRGLLDLGSGCLLPAAALGLQVGRPAARLAGPHHRCRGLAKPAALPVSVRADGRGPQLAPELPHREAALGLALRAARRAVLLGVQRRLREASLRRAAHGRGRLWSRKDCCNEGHGGGCDSRRHRSVRWCGERSALFKSKREIWP